MEKCLADKGLQEALVKRRTETEKQFQLIAPGSFAINYGEDVVTGIHDFEEFDKVMKKYVK